MANYDANATPNMNFFIPIQPDTITFLPTGMSSGMDNCINIHVYGVYIV